MLQSSAEAQGRKLRLSHVISGFRSYDAGYISCLAPRMGIAHDLSVAAGHALSGVHAGEKKLASHKVATALSPSIQVTSHAFDAGGGLPVACTVDGAGAPPPIEFHGVPREATSIVLICEDPDAPIPEPYVHWLVYGVPGSAGRIDMHSQVGYRQGLNSKLDRGYTPAAPPPGHGLHHYHFQVFALDHGLALEAGAGRGDVIDAMQGHVISWGEVVATYQRE
jgi:Raf kinase inhibitor-like YbhB/YbcL family protein